jgi:type II secretory pathway component PulF
LTVAKVLDQQDARQAAVMLKGLPTYWIPLLSAATTSSDPGRVLREFLRESQRADELRQQWWLALAYPVLLACVAAAVMTALSFLVIPIFREIFQGFGLRLPLLTQFVLNLADWITDGRLVLAILLALAIGWALLQAVRLLPPALRQWLSDRSPFVFGRWTARARFAQFAADLLEAQLDVPGAIRVAAFASGNSRLQRSASRLAGAIEAGESLPPHKLRPLLTAALAHALRAEMPAPSRIRLLSEISRGYAERAQRGLSWTRGVIEPLGICLIGAIVGCTVIALFLPLIRLIQGLAA